MNLYYMCKTFGVLPYPGGLLDQPARLVYMFEMVELADSERQQKEYEAERKKANSARKR